ncbi:MAG: CvpA family protein, partial [Acetobacteraceae bacterium]
MTWVDFVVLAVLAVSALLAFVRGLVREVLGLAAYIGAIFAGVWALPRIRPQFQTWLGHSPWVDPVAFAVVFVITLIVLV